MNHSKFIIKICGITHPDDARIAAQKGADWIGIVHAHHSKRSVEVTLAAEIASAAIENGALPVGVFVNEQADSVIKIAQRTGIKKVQLYGNSLGPDYFSISKEIKTLV